MPHASGHHYAVLHAALAVMLLAVFVVVVVVAVDVTAIYKQTQIVQISEAWGIQTALRVATSETAVRPQGVEGLSMAGPRPILEGFHGHPLP
jgi:hypothetical protein